MDFRARSAKRLQAIRKINDLDERWVEEQVRLATNSLAKSGKKIGTYSGADVYQTGDIGSNWLCLVDNDELLYVIKSRRKSFGGRLYGQQVAAARVPDVSNLATVGFAVHAFMNVYLKRYGMIVSDSQMTTKGFITFGNVVKKALTVHKYVYLYDRRSTPNKWIPVRRWSEFKNTKDFIFNPESANQTRLIVVSNTEIVV